MKKIKWFLFLVILIGCQDEEEFDYPLIHTGEVTNINSSGATFSAKIVDLSKDDIIEYGFVWGTTIDPTIEESEKFIIRDIPKSGIFNRQIQTTLNQGVEYYVRAFVRSKEYITYGKSVSFLSLGSGAPTIKDFYPKQGNIDDTITIIGDNFSYKQELNIVKFNDFTSKIVKSVQDTLTVIVPKNLNVAESKISVSIINNISLSELNFQLIAPNITDFQPKEAPFGSSIIISGSNFLSNPNSVKVYFGEFESVITSLSNDQIEVQIPIDLNTEKSKLKVQMNNITDSSSTLFSLILPNIDDFNPKVSGFGSSIDITGSLLNTNPERLKVFFDKYQAEITELNSNNLKVSVPDSLDARTSTLSIDINGMKVNAVDNFSLSGLILDNFYPQTNITGETFTIKGNNFSPIPSNNIVKIGNVIGEVVSASPDSIEVLLPLQDEFIYNDRELTLSVEVIDDKQKFNDSIIINDKWFRLSNFTDDNISNASHFVFNDEVYLGLSGTNKFWKFNPESQIWTRLEDFPGEVRNNGAGFIINDIIYFGTGFTINRQNLRDFWKYDISSDSWIQLNNFSGSARNQASGFNIGEIGYLTSGVYSQSAIYNHPYGDCWEYDYLTDTWQEISSYGDLEWGGVDGLAQGVTIVSNDIAYFGLGWNYTQGDYKRRIYTFNPSIGNIWNRVENFPESRDYSKAVAFSLNDVPYFKTVNSDFYKYNDINDSWEIVETNILTGTQGAIGFSISNKAYIGLGSSNAMWEYDPSR